MCVVIETNTRGRIAKLRQGMISGEERLHDSVSTSECSGLGRRLNTLNTDGAGTHVEAAHDLDLLSLELLRFFLIVNLVSLMVRRLQNVSAILLHNFAVHGPTSRRQTSTQKRKNRYSFTRN